MKISEQIYPPTKHYFHQQLHVYIYEDVFDDKFYQKLRSAVISLFNRSTLTYKTHRTNFAFNGQTHKIVSHQQNAREQQVSFDLTFEPEYWYQTADTIKSWSNNWLMNNINPVFYRFIKFFENQKPFIDEPDCYIPYRWHSNILSYSKFLSFHSDMNDVYFNTHSTHVARARSVTFYLYDHVENMGGEFWAETGFVYKPKSNSAICVNGNGIYHGVNANVDPDSTKVNPRLAFTTRWAHKDDLMLPGHPSKTLYKLDFNDSEN